MHVRAGCVISRERHVRGRARNDAVREVEAHLVTSHVTIDVLVSPSLSTGIYLLAKR